MFHILLVIRMFYNYVETTQLMCTALSLPSGMFNGTPQCKGRVEYPRVPTYYPVTDGVIFRAYGFPQAPPKPEGLGGVVDVNPSLLYTKSCLVQNAMDNFLFRIK